MRQSVLKSIDLPQGIAGLSASDTERLAREVRDLIIEVVSSNGGHLAPSLGVVELTIALLAVLDTPRDKIIWDVGHQCYAHKILTDRREVFPTIRQAGGISGFPKPEESPHDAFTTGHASTAISAALGIAQGRDLAREDYRVTAVVGDGALGGGMAWEAINSAGESQADMLVILNDNKMSISPSIGALAAHIARLRAMPLYQTVEDGAEKIIENMPLGRDLMRKTSRVLKHGVTSWVSPTSGTIFEALGFTYLGPIDGHDIPALKRFITQAHLITGPVLLHVVTTKGKGYGLAENNARHYHGVGPFDSSNGKSSHKGGISYTQVFGNTLIKLAQEDSRIVAITAAMPDGTGLDRYAKKFPSRFFNVGIAEEHAVTFAAGLAGAGMKPVVAIYSTFLQRAYDQIIHDVCLQNLPVVFTLDRAGIVGEDGPTHHGVFDLSYLRHIPNLTIMAPKDAGELADMLYTAFDIGGPVAIRYPRGEACGTERAVMQRITLGKSEQIRDGGDVAVVAIGAATATAVEAAESLNQQGVGCRVVNARFVKPLDEAAVVSAAQECSAIVVVEENTSQGGFGSAVLECLARNRLWGTPVEVVALPDSFITHGRACDLREKYGLCGKGIVSVVKRLLASVEASKTEQGDEVVIQQSL